MKKAYLRRDRLGLGRRNSSTSRRKRKILLWNTCARKSVRGLGSPFILRVKSLQLFVDRRIDKGWVVFFAEDLIGMLGLAKDLNVFRATNSDWIRI